MPSKLFYKLQTIFNPKSKSLFHPSKNDIYLVSYPRSGNTWMRVIISEILYGTAGKSIIDLRYYVPDLHEENYIDEVIDSNFHVVKSHFPNILLNNQIDYDRVIYLIRDPRDVVISYFRYQKDLGYYHSDFQQFLLDWINGRIWPCSWQEHVNSWIGDGSQFNSISKHIYRYEDFLVDIKYQILKLADFLGKNITKEDLHRISSSVSVEEMREKEERGICIEVKEKEFNFIGPATSNQWKTLLTKKQLNLINKYAGFQMDRYGYI